MAAPAIVSGYTHAENASNSTTLIIDAPTHADGDMLVVAWVTDGDGATATISGTGWTTLEGPKDVPSTSVTNAGAFYVWYKTANSEGASYTITTSVSERSVAMAFGVNGHNGIDVEATYASGVDTSAEVGALTTNVNDCLRISIVCSQGVRTVSTLTGHTLLATHSYVSAGTLSVQYKTVASAGADAGQTATLDASAWGSYAFAIAPLGGAEQTIYPDAIASAAQVFAPTLALAAVTISFGFIAGASTVYAPSLFPIVADLRRIWRIPAEDRTYYV